MIKHQTVYGTLLGTIKRVKIAALEINSSLLIPSKWGKKLSL